MSSGSDKTPAPNARPTGLVCPMCGLAVLVRRHCKTLCEQCGYVESCEDNFVPMQESPKGK